MKKNVYAVGFLIFAATMLVFFGMYFFGMNTEYFNNSMLINAFLMPVIYTIGAFISVNNFKKWKGSINFREAFRQAFMPMFTGGLLSMFTIYIFLNFVDSDAKRLLNFQYIERQRTELYNEYSKAKQIMAKNEDKQELEKKYQERKQSLSDDMVKNKDMFSFRQFTIYFAAILVFYVILSVFFGSFFRSRYAS